MGRSHVPRSWPVYLLAVAITAGHLVYAETQQEPSNAVPDYRSISSVDVGCREKGPVIMGNLPCQDQDGKPGLFSKVENLVKAGVAIETHNLYEGIGTNFATGASRLTARPVCNISQGEVNRNYLSKSNGCGSWCGMRVETGFLSGKIVMDDKGGHCDREYGWYRGAHVQVMNFFKEKVFAEWRSHNVKLVDIDGAKPCAAVAADVVWAQNSTNKVLQYVIDMQGPEKAASIKCPIDRKLASLEEALETGPASHGACQLNMAHLRLQALWSAFLGCEVRWRTFKEFQEKFSDPDKWIADVKTAIQPRCEEAARHCTQNGQSLLERNQVCNDGMRTKFLNECYHREAPQFLRDKMRPYDTTKPPERPSVHSSVGFGLFFLLGSLKRRSPAPKKRKRKKTFLALLLSLLGFVLTACDCDTNDMVCSPCTSKPISEQNIGCVQKACMQTLYLCFAGADEVSQDFYSSADSIAADYSASSGVGIESLGAAMDIRCFRPRVITTEAGLSIFQEPAVNDLKVKIAEMLKASGYKKEKIKSSAATLGIEYIEFSDARLRCRELAGLPKDPDEGNEKYGGNASHLANREDVHMAGSAVSAAQIDAIAKTANRMGLESGVPDPSCPSVPPGTGPEAGGPGNVPELDKNLTAAQQLFGKSNSDFKKTPQLAGNGSKSENAATAAQKADFGGKPEAARGPGSAGPIAKLPAVRAGMGGSGSGAGSSGSTTLGLGAFGEGSNGSAGLAGGDNSEKPTTVAGGATFEAAGASGKSGSGYSGFGSGSEGAVGPGSAADTAYGSAQLGGSVVDLESYLEKMGKTSLFEVVNRRMDKWGGEIERENQRSAFKKLSQ